MELAVTTATDTDNPVLGDFYVGSDGKEKLITNLADQVAQRLYVRFEFFRGEWFLDLRLGLPYFDQILIKGQDDQVMRSFFSQTISQDPGVASIKSLSIDTERGTRVATVTFVAQLIDGSSLDSSNYPPFLVTP